MIRAFLQNLLSIFGGQPGPAQLRSLLVLAFVIILVGALWIWLKPKDESAFQVREADRIKSRPKDMAKDNELAQARIKLKKKPLALTGIRINGAPHEILGIQANATKEEIQAAYRDLMKRYHPDKIGPAGSQQWKDSQRIAEAINHAKEQLLKSRK